MVANPAYAYYHVLDGDPTTVTQGPVDQAPLLLAPPLPSSTSSFAETSHCDSVQNTMTVTLTWVSAQGEPATTSIVMAP